VSQPAAKPHSNGKRVLLVDDDELICKSLRRLLESDGFAVDVANNGETARNLISLENFDLVLSDIHMPGKISGIELFHFVKQSKDIPFVLMTGFATLAETREANELGVNGFLAKPFKMDDLKKLLLEIIAEEARKSPEPQQESINESYCKLGIDDFISGKQIQYQIFVKLGEDKYIKIAHEGQDLTIERIQSYKEKGIRHLYLLKDDFQKYMKFNLGLVSLVKTNHTVPKQKKLHLMKHTSEVILEQIYSANIDAQSFEDAKAVVEASVAFLAEHQETCDLLSALNTQSDVLYAHSVGVSMYAAMVSRKMGWHSPSTLYKVSMGGLFHDIGKKEIAREILVKPRTSLNAEEVRTLETHPTRGAELLSTVPSVSSDVLQIALQHHEHDLGTGYPAGLKRGKIHPLAKLVGFVDEFCYWVLKGPDSPGVPVEDAIRRITMLYGSSLDTTFLQALKRVCKLTP